MGARTWKGAVHTLTHTYTYTHTDLQVHIRQQGQICQKADYVFTKYVYKSNFKIERKTFTLKLYGH